MVYLFCHSPHQANQAREGGYQVSLSEILLSLLVSVAGSILGYLIVQMVEAAIMWQLTGCVSSAHKRNPLRVITPGEGFLLANRCQLRNSVYNLSYLCVHVKKLTVKASS